MLDEFEGAAPGFVAAGAEWLDENEPGWEGRIDLAILRLDGCATCVLGQVTREGHYRRALVSRGLDLTWAAAHGFNVVSPHGAFSHFAVLDELWTALVKERHDTGNLSGVTP